MVEEVELFRFRRLDYFEEWLWRGSRWEVFGIVPERPRESDLMPEASVEGEAFGEHGFEGSPVFGSGLFVENDDVLGSLLFGLVEGVAVHS